MSLNIRSMKQLNELLIEAGPNLVLIDFFANWCGPCKEIAPKLDELGKQLANVLILKINVDECEDIVEAYDITVLPTFVFLRHRHKLETFTGNDFEKLKETVIKLSKPKIHQHSAAQIPGQSQRVYGGSKATIESQLGMIQQAQIAPQLQSQIAPQIQSQTAPQFQSQPRLPQFHSQSTLPPQRPVQLQSQGTLPQSTPLQSQSTIQPPPDKSQFQSQGQLQPNQIPPRNPERR